MKLLKLTPEFVVEAVSNVIVVAAAMAGGPVSALSAVFLLDFVLGFDSTGQATVVVPKNSWIDFGKEERRVDRFWTRGYARYSKSEEFYNVKLRHSVERILGIVRGLVLGTAFPVVGSWANAGLSSIEYLSEAFPEEIEAPQNPWFKTQSYNCTNRITVPWDLALTNVRGIDIQIPVDLTDGDYIGIYSNFTAYSTWKSVLNVNIPFVREHGNFEVAGAFREGGPLDTDQGPPTCERPK